MIYKLLCIIEIWIQKLFIMKLLQLADMQDLLDILIPAT